MPAITPALSIAIALAGAGFPRVLELHAEQRVRARQQRQRGENRRDGPNDEAHDLRENLSIAALQGGQGEDTVIGNIGKDTMDGGPQRDFVHSQERDFAGTEELDPLVQCQAPIYGQGPPDASRDRNGQGGRDALGGAHT